MKESNEFIQENHDEQQEEIRIIDSFRFKGFIYLFLSCSPSLIYIFLAIYSNEITLNLEFFILISILISISIPLTWFAISHLFKMREFIITDDKIIYSTPIQIKSLSDDGMYHFEMEWSNIERIELKKGLYEERYRNPMTLFRQKADYVLNFISKSNEVKKLNFGTSELHRYKIDEIIDNLMKYAQKKNKIFEIMDDLEEIVPKEYLEYYRRREEN